MTAVMSEGIKPYDFVQQVYYLQEKTILDFWPTDDKYREVLMEANLVLGELEAQEDWTWLRETLVLGSCDGITDKILTFKLPSDVYKVSTLFNDCLKLYPIEAEDTINDEYILNEVPFIPVPITSAGNYRYHRQVQTTGIEVNHVRDLTLRASIHGDTIKFNRPLLDHEANMVAVVDVQKHIDKFHICVPFGNNSCTLDSNHVCPKAKTVYLTEVPDPNYVITATAARHAEGSPPALARVAGLQDAAQRLLSQMRSNDASATDPDYAEWDVPGYIEVI